MVPWGAYLNFVLNVIPDPQHHDPKHSLREERRERKRKRDRESKTSREKRESANVRKMPGGKKEAIKN